MTISSEIAFNALAWTGSQTAFAPGIKCQATSHLRVYSRDASNADTLLTENVHYSVALSSEGLATVTPIALPSAPRTLLFERVTPALQATDFGQLYSFAPGIHTLLHDAAALRDAELRLAITRALLAPRGDTVGNLPLAADRANKILGFDASGNPQALLPGSSASLGQVAVEFVIDGGGAAITAGIKADISFPFACTLNGWRLLADQSGSIVLDLWKAAFAAYPPVAAGSICSGNKPTLSAATKAEDVTLAGVTRAFAAGDTLRVNVDSAAAVARVTLALLFNKT